MTETSHIDESPWLTLLDHASDGIVVVAPQPWRLIHANTTFASWLHRKAEQLRGRAIDELFGEDAARELLQKLDDVWDETAPDATFTLEPFSEMTSGSPLTIHLQRVPHGNSPMIAMLVRSSDSGGGSNSASERGRRDPLTGLPDRSVLMARLTALVGGERLADGQFAVLFIDLDNFKHVNDDHGHLVGDRVLAEVGRRLANCVRAGDTIVRFGGDEFVALLERVSGWEEIEPVVERIHAALSEPITLAEGDVALSLSMGMAEASAEHRTPEDILRAADRAMYESKRLQT